MGDEAFDVGRVVDAGDDGAEAFESDLVGVAGGEGRRGRLEDAADREDLEHRVVVVQVDDERHRLEEQARFETRDVGAVATSHVEHADDLERLHRLAQRTSATGRDAR